MLQVVTLGSNPKYDPNSEISQSTSPCYIFGTTLLVTTVKQSQDNGWTGNRVLVTYSVESKELDNREFLVVTPMIENDEYMVKYVENFMIISVKSSGELYLKLNIKQFREVLKNKKPEETK